MKSLKEVSLGLLSAIASTVIILGAILVAMTEGIALSIPTVEPTPAFPVIEPTVLPGTIAPTRTASPTSQRPAIVTITPTKSCISTVPANWTSYSTQPGDKLSDLAQSFGVSVAQIKAVNCYDFDSLMAGYLLYLPAPTATPTLTFTVTNTRTFSPTFTLTSASVTCKGTPSNWLQYVVQSGDNLFRLSLSVGMDWHDVMTFNCLTSQYIVTGQVLFLPRLPASKPTSTSTPRPPAPTSTPVPTRVLSKTPTRTPLPVNHTLTINKTGAGSGTVTSSPAGIDCGSTCSFSFASGTSVTLSQSAAPGSTFSGWSGGGCNGTASCVVSLAADTTVTANFTQNQYTLAVVSAHGPVSKAPDQATYTYGQAVVVTMGTVEAGWTFVGWNGGACTGTAPCTVNMTADTTVTANFTQNQYTLAVVSDHGPVTKAPDQATYTYGQAVVLTMGTVEAGWTFTGWSGGGCTGTAPCTVNMTADTTVTANFTQNQYTLTVVSDHGPVTKAPDQATYTYGQAVVLTMGTVEAGWTFTGWIGGGCSGTDPCTVTMTADTTVNAGFTQN